MTRRYFPRFGTWGWILILLVVSGSTLFVTTRELQRVKIAQKNTFAGQLSLGADIISVKLPQGAVLDSIIVKPGQLVRANQTLAVIDPTNLPDRIDQFQRQIVALDLERMCIGDEALSASPAVFKTRKTDVDGLQRNALEKCRQFNERHRFKTRRLQKEIDLLLERVRLLEKKGKATLAHASRTGATPNLTRSMAHTLIAQNEIKRQILGLETELNAAHLAINAERAHAKEDLGRETLEIRRKLNALQRLVKSPRVTAPIAGTVQRVRMPKSKNATQGASEIVQISSQERQSVSLWMQVHKDVISSIPLGTKVNFTVTAGARGTRTFSAKIAGVGQLAHLPNHIRVTLQPSDDALHELWNSDAFLALRNENSFASIHVQTQPISISKVISAVGRDVRDQIFSTLSWAPSLVGLTFS